MVPFQKNFGNPSGGQQNSSAGVPGTTYRTPHGDVFIPTRNTGGHKRARQLGWRVQRSRGVEDTPPPAPPTPPAAADPMEGLIGTGPDEPDGWIPGWDEYHPDNYPPLQGDPPRPLPPFPGDSAHNAGRPQRPPLGPPPTPPGYENMTSGKGGGYSDKWGAKGHRLSDHNATSFDGAPGDDPAGHRARLIKKYGKGRLASPARHHKRRNEILRNRKPQAGIDPGTWVV